MLSNQLMPLGLGGRKMSAEHCLYRFTTWTSTQSLQSTVRGPKGRIFSTITPNNGESNGKENGK